MRLWHQALIHYLDNKRLLGQHRECCALRGKGWTKKHSTIDYIKKYGLDHLYQYHLLVMNEMMTHRNFTVDGNWFIRTYRGKHLPSATLCEVGSFVDCHDEPIYPEHDDAYLRECLLNLKSKNAKLANGASIDEWLVKLDLEEAILS